MPVGPNFATRHNPRTTMTSPPDLHRRLARTLITAMKDAAAPARLIAVSTASMGPADNAMGAAPLLLFRFLRTVAVPNLGRVGKDLHAMEDELAASIAIQGAVWGGAKAFTVTSGPGGRTPRRRNRKSNEAVSRPRRSGVSAKTVNSSTTTAAAVSARLAERAPRGTLTPVRPNPNLCGR